MQKLIVLLVFVSLLSLPLMAQDNPKVEVFGGWEYQHLGGNFGDFLGSPEQGWDASATGNFSKHFGVTADVSGSYKSYTVGGVNGHTHIYTYTFGPVVSLNSAGKFNPFVHVLLGESHVSYPFLYNISNGQASYTSTNGFTAMFGGGVDLKVNKAIAIRLPQVDWVSYHANGNSYNSNVRISIGVVFRF